MDSVGAQPLRSVDGRRILDLPGFVSRRLRVAGSGELHFVQGPANGPPLLLLPGLLDPWHGYSDSANELARRFEVFLVSLRGHGPSSPALDGRYRVCDYGQDIDELIQQVVRAPALIAGNSLGGLVALWLASNRPRSVLAICLEDAPLFVTELPAWSSHWMRTSFENLVRAIDAKEALGGDATTLAEQIAAIPIVRPKVHLRRADRVSTMAAIRGQLGPVAVGHAGPSLEPGWQMYVEQGVRPAFGAFYPSEAIEQLAGVLQVVDGRTARAVVEGQLNEGFDHALALSRVHCPMLVLEADRLLSGIVDSADFERACRLAAGEFRHVYAEGAGHQIHVDKPVWFAQELTAFFLGPASSVSEPHQ